MSVLWDFKQGSVLVCYKITDLKQPWGGLLAGGHIRSRVGWDAMLIDVL